ncbi:MAG: NDP-sugar synthase [Phycisphaerae bacterium]|nr:NDP-sugar synthase [Phycisphaerae bacterium]
MQYTLDWLTGAGISCVTVCGNGDTNALRTAVTGNAAPACSIQFSEDRIPRGPAGCARDAAVTCEASTLVLAYGTVIPRLDLAAMLAAHEHSGAAMTVALRGPADSASNGTARTPAGVYVISRRVLEGVSSQGYHDLKEALIPSLHRRGERVAAYPVPAGSVIPVYDTASYLRANQQLLQDFVATERVAFGFRRSGDGLVAASAHVAPDARLLGPVLVSGGARVSAGALIVGPAIIGSDCTVGSDAVITRSVIWNHVRVADRAVVDGCVLTDAAEVGSEAIARRAVWGAGGPRRRSRSVRLARLARRWVPS